MLSTFRPSGVAWEVRKTTSPSKPQPSKQAEAVPGGGGGRSVSGRCVRNLDMSGSSLTWADRVRGRTTSGPRGQGEKDEGHCGRDQGTKEQKRSGVDMEKRGSENTAAREKMEDGGLKRSQEMGEEGGEMMGEEGEEGRGKENMEVTGESVEVRGEESGDGRGKESMVVTGESGEVRGEKNGDVREVSGEMRTNENGVVTGKDDGKEDTIMEPSQSATVTSLDSMEQECCEEEVSNSAGNVLTEDTADTHM